MAINNVQIISAKELESEPHWSAQREKKNM